uniref:CARDB domain-containing protein n=1 Tax=uncultured marine group II/III euryarchaeote KM3_110_C01 TaxID=1457851 RepID=A0A075G698_9EURY|nr:hypothetical protein [uncultured marine group II/III euryarchaeote KM3_110_C01]
MMAMKPEESNANGGRRMLVALIAGALLFTSLALTSTVSAASPITLASSASTGNVLAGESVTFTLTLTSSDSTYNYQTVKLYGSWLSGTDWPYVFEDSSGNELVSQSIDVAKGGTATAYLSVYCLGACTGGTSNTITVYGKSDPRYMTVDGDDNAGDPASSSNATNSIDIVVTAVNAYTVDVTAESTSAASSNKVYQGETTVWRYTVTNTGWNDDTYDFSVSTTANGWTLTTGLSNGLEVKGQSNTVATHSHTGEMTITPFAGASPGTYTVTISATSSNGASDSATISVVLPEPDLEIKATDISFSHTSAWITARGNSQLVTITAKVRNNGGDVDTAGNSATNVDVWFTVDGSTVGTVQYVSSLGHGDEETVSVSYKPNRPHSDSETGLPVKVMVDQYNNLDGSKPEDKAIKESDETNNEASTTFKVVRIKTANPSFYLGFTALTASVGAAVLLSRYYRSEDEE